MLRPEPSAFRARVNSRVCSVLYNMRQIACLSATVPLVPTWFEKRFCLKEVSLNKRFIDIKSCELLRKHCYFEKRFKCNILVFG